MLDWILLVVAIVGGGIVLVRPGWVGHRHGFPGSTLLGFVLISVGMTSPLLLHLNELMLDASGGEDAFVGIWNLWWTKQALLHGDNPFFTFWLSYPSGTSLALHTHSVTYGVATLPLQIVFAPHGGAKLYGIYNLILLGSFTTTAYFTYRLAFYESRHRAASILAGLIFAFCAFRFANTTRLHLIATEFLVLSTWASVRWMRRPSAPRLFGLLGAIVLLAHASLEYTVLAFLIFGWIVLSRILPSRLQPAPMPPPNSSEGRRAILRAVFHEEPPPRARMRRWSWVGIAVLVCAFLPLATQLFHRMSGGGTGFEPRLGEYYSADLLDLLLPNPRHPIWGQVSARFTANRHLGDAGFGTHLGVVALFLFAFTLRYSTRAHQGRRWAYGAIFFVILALGSRLHINGEILPIPLPHAIISHLPILGGIREPVHYFAGAQLFLAIAIASGWAGLTRSRRRAVMAQTPDAPLDVPFPFPTRGEVALGVGLLFSSLAAPWIYTEEPIPRVYEIVRQRSGGRTASLLHVPGLRARHDLLYQTVHGQRLIDDVSGAIPRHDGTEEALRTQMWETLALGFAQPGFVAGLSEEQRSALRELALEYFRHFEIRWIVVPSDPAHQSVGTADRLPQNLLGRAAYQAYRENLRQLQPIWEEERNGFTLFEF